MTTMYMCPYKFVANVCPRLLAEWQQYVDNNVFIHEPAGCEVGPMLQKTNDGWRACCEVDIDLSVPTIGQSIKSSGEYLRFRRDDEYGVCL